MAGGYLTFGVLVAIAARILTTEVPGMADPQALSQSVTPSSVLLVHLTYSIVFAVVGGFVAAAIGKPRGFKAALTLASLLVILQLIRVFEPVDPTEPIWYLLGLLFTLGPAAALGGHFGSGRRRYQHSSVED